jgi:hypothetical protein
MADNVVLRGDANVFTFGDRTGYEVGASVPIYFQRIYQGPFLEAGLITRELGTTAATSTFVGPEIMLGWHVTYDSGLNAAAALGYAYSLTEIASRKQPAGYFRIGYAF